MILKLGLILLFIPFGLTGNFYFLMHKNNDEFNNVWCLRYNDIRQMFNFPIFLILESSKFF